MGISKKAFIAVIFALFVAAGVLFPLNAHAAEIANPYKISGLSADFRQYGEISVSGENVKNIGLNITTPQNKLNQNTAYFSKNALNSDRLGNDLVSILEETPEENFKYDISGSLKINSIKTSELPQRYTINESMAIYLAPTKNIQSGDPEISSIAKEITASATSEFEKAAALAIWVHNYVNYTLSMGETAKDAKWVLKNRIGTCDEFSTLFIAMARSIGIPAKYVSGYVYGEEGWQKHAWSEVYLGQWVPVDATWLEAGNLDATHVRFFETYDNYVANQVNAFGTSIGELKWLSDNTDFEVKGISESESIDYTASISAGTIGFGKSAVVIAKIIPEEYFIDTLALENCKGLDLLDIEDKSQDAVFEPGKETYVAWKVTSKTGLDKGKIYTCPLTINAKYLKNKVVPLTVDPRINNDGASFGANLEKKSVYLGDKVTASASLKNAPEKMIKIGAVTDGANPEKIIGASKGGEISVSFSFAAEKLGTRKMLIYSELGDVYSGEYTVSRRGNVYIEKIELPKMAKIGSAPKITVSVKNSDFAEQKQSVRIDITPEGGPSISKLMLIGANSTEKISADIAADKSGLKKIVVSSTAKGIQEETAYLRIYGTPKANASVSYAPDKKTANVLLFFSGDEAKNVAVSFAGSEKKEASIIGEKTFAFNANPGKYALTVSYEDFAGEKYAIKQNVELKSGSIIERILSLLSSIF